MLIFLHEKQKEMSEEEINQLLRLAKKFFCWRRSSYVAEDEDMSPVAWLKGNFEDAGDGITSIEIAISDNENLFNNIVREDDDLDFEFIEE